MDKDVFYFSHDSNARHDPNIVKMLSKYSWEGYGMYWALVEAMREDGKISLCMNDLEAIAYDTRIEKDKLVQFVDDCIDVFKLFRKNGNRFWSDSLRRRVDKMRNRSEKARGAAHIRWHSDPDQPELDLHSDGNAESQSVSNANEMQMHSDSNAIKKGNKGNKTNKEIKEERVNETFLSWNKFADENGLVQASKLTDRRISGIKLRLSEKEFDLERIYQEIKNSIFLRGDNERKWRVDFDFVFCSQNNYLKILEGKYRGNNSKQRTGSYHFDPQKYPTLNRKGT